MESSNPIEFEYYFDRFLWHIDETLNGTTNLSESRNGSNGNEELFFLLNASDLLP